MTPNSSDEQSHGPLQSSNQDDGAAAVIAARNNKAITQIQAAQRGRAERKQVELTGWEIKEDQKYENAVRLVEKLMASDERPETVRTIASTLLSTDFVDAVDLPGSRYTCIGVNDYLVASISRPQPKAVRTLIVPWATGSFLRGDHEETHVEREVLLEDSLAARIEYTVRHDAHGGQNDRICERRTVSLDAKAEPLDSAEVGREHQFDLKASFEKLAEGSGLLSVETLVGATQLIGLNLNKEDVQHELKIGDRKRSQPFELRELDGMLRNERRLKMLGLEQRHDRPVLLDIMPLAAGAYEVHAAVAECIGRAEELDEKNAEKAHHARAMEAKKLTSSPNLVAVKRAAWKGGSGALRRPQPGLVMPPGVKEVRAALDRSTSELAGLVAQLEHLRSIDGDSSMLKELHASLDEACADCVRQQQHLQPITQAVIHNVLPSRSDGESSTRTPTRKFADKRPRRPHMLPSMQSQPGGEARKARQRLRQSVSEPIVSSRRSRLAP